MPSTPASRSSWPAASRSREPCTRRSERALPPRCAEAPPTPAERLLEDSAIRHADAVLEVNELVAAKRRRQRTGPRPARRKLLKAERQLRRVRRLLDRGKPRARIVRRLVTVLRTEGKAVSALGD